MTPNTFIYSAPGKIHGGIHPQEFKTLSNTQPIKSLNPSSHLVLPLKQHIGSLCEPLVAIGEQVTMGQAVAQTPNKTMTIHAPANGEIAAIGNFETGHPSKQPTQAIIIKQQQNTSLHLPNNEKLDWQKLSAEELISQVNDAGIVGLGGATFPTAIKLKSQKIDTLIVNAMECEPYITCDDRLLQEQANDVIEGATIAAHILQASKIIFAIEDNKSAAIEQLDQALKQLASNAINAQIKYSICVAPTKYPSGGEKQTIELVTGKQLPKGELPASMGIVVQNVATLHAIYQAVVFNHPLTQRLVTLTGDSINEPGNYWLPFGTKISDIMAHFNIEPSGLNGVILGGPMMGNSTSQYDTPVSKSTNCIIFNSNATEQKSWVLNATAHDPCIRCSECQNACPVDLLPQQLLWFSQSEQWDSLEEQGLFDCIECGACAYVCPSEIPLVQYYRFGKSEVKAIKKSQQKSDKAKQRFDFREMRIARAKEERALKHKKAAEARKKAAQSAKDAKPKDEQADKKAAINEALARVKQKKSQQTNENTTTTSNTTSNVENNQKGSV